MIDIGQYMTEEQRLEVPDMFWDARTASDGGVYQSCTVAGDHVLIYYNPALLEEAGITLPEVGDPWTWSEFIENAKKLTVDVNGNQLGEDDFDSENVVQWGFVPRLDNEKIFEDLYNYTLLAAEQPWIRRGDDGEWDIFFDEEAMDSIESYMSVINIGVTPMEAIGLGGSSQDQLFVDGTAAMVQRAYFNVSVLRERYPDFEFDIMTVPMESGSPYYTSPTVGQGFSVPVTSEHPEEAAKFAIWFQQPEIQAIWTNALFLAPCNTSAMEETIISENEWFDVLRWYFDNQEFLSAEVNPNISEFKTTVFGPTMMDVLLGELTLDEGMSIIKEVSKDILNQ